MKKVPRLRLPQQDDTLLGGSEAVGVRTTGRIKKPKAVFDPSDNYLPRSQRSSNAPINASSSSSTGAGTTSTERRKETPEMVSQQQQQKRLSQSSGTSMGTTTTTTGSIDVANVDVCSVCMKREAKRGTHAKNKLITCLECERKAHKLCLKVEFEDFDLLRQNYKCENCRTCEVCDAFSDCDQKLNQDLVTCVTCVKSYHLTCHIPNVHKFQPVHHWKCNKCQLPNARSASSLPAKTIREIIGGETKITKPSASFPNDQQQQQQQQQQQAVNIAAAAVEAKNAAAKRTLQEQLKNGLTQMAKFSNGLETANDFDNADGSLMHKKQKIIQEGVSSGDGGGATTPIRYSPNEPLDVPDVKDWSVDQVAAYFAKYFPNEAHVFKEHEIDGTSLLLLKRSDVIKKLPIKLGPSLRIYSLILKIQTQINDPTLGWNCGL